MIDIAFCSLWCRDERYGEQLLRLKSNLESIYKNPKLYFYEDTLPDGSRTHLESLYGFKPHVINSAKQDNNKLVIWLDTSILLNSNIDYLYEISKKVGVVAGIDETALWSVTSEKCKEYFGYNEIPKHFKLVGGSFYYFNFETDLGNRIFDTWLEAEKNDIFNSADENTKGDNNHRNDETVMALSLIEHDSYPLRNDYLKYCCDGAVIEKHHFK